MASGCSPAVGFGPTTRTPERERDNQRRYRIWYDVQGNGDALILTGGFGLVHDQFERVTPLLVDEHCVLNWNWRAVGRSDRGLGSAPSIDAWTQDLEAVLDASNIDTATLWGTSTGALVSLHFAARHPERVRIAASEIPVLLLGGTAGPVGLDAPPIRAQRDTFLSRVPRAQSEACVKAVRAFLGELA